MSSDAETVQRTLQGWARDGKLSSATLSADGTSLSLDGTTVAANVELNLSHEGKSCSFSAASIFLQLLDPNQSLVKYRGLCKKHQVKDPVKATQKPIVLGVFLGLSTGLASEAAPVAPPASSAAPAASSSTAAAPPSSEAKADRKERKKEKSSKDKRKEQRTSSSSSKHPRKKSKHSKQPKSLVTNEQVFESLNVVVDKRQITDHLKEREEITKALSPEGFQVTPELLAEHQERAKVIMANEIPVGNSASILRAANPNKNLSRVLELYQESVSKGKRSSSSKKNPSAGSGAKPIRRHLIGKKPVIIVPKGMTAAITLPNAHEFLAKARFIPRDVLLKQQGRAARNPPTTFTRTVQASNGVSGLLEYEIIDNPRKLGNTQQEWDRVVAVVVLGHSWQFKDWLKGFHAPATLFENAYGFFVCMEGAKVPAEVGTWAVHHARLNRDKRGLDQVAYASFWNGLDEFMRVRKPELLPQGEV